MHTLLTPEEIDALLHGLGDEDRDGAIGQNSPPRVRGAKEAGLNPHHEATHSRVCPVCRRAVPRGAALEA